MATALSIHSREPPGDILCFLPSAKDVDEAVRLLEHRLMEDGLQGSSSMSILSLYDGMPLPQQLMVFDNLREQQRNSNGKETRRCIISTSVAETGITVPRVRYVVDSGFTRYNYFDVKSGVETWITCLASRAVATQRAGRACRTGPGRVYRLMPGDTYTGDEVQDHAPPEMQRADDCRCTATQGYWG